MDLDRPAAQDDPLSQPTRARLFKLLVELRRPAATAELAERCGLHPNGVRLHLERMADAGLVERARFQQPRGRPRDAWSVAPGAAPGGEGPTAYSDLGRWLVRALGRRGGGTRAVENVGREIGRELAPPAPGEADALLRSLSALGFRPRMSTEEDGRVSYCLGNCPYRDAVRENQELVCGLHRGITRGLLDVLDPSSRLAAFVPGDPDAAGCLIELRSQAARSR